MLSDHTEFYDIFASFYDAFRPERAGEVEFYVAQATRARGPVLELGCGTGRLLIPVARTGKPTWGIDSSRGMLDVIRAKLACTTDGSTSLNVELREADMTSFTLEPSFGLIMVPYHTFQHLVEEVAQLACLERIRRHLGPGGTLALDVAGMDPALLPRGRRPIRVERHERFRHPDVAGELESVFSAEIDRASGMAVQTRSLRRGSVDLVSASTRVKYLRTGEIECLLERSGFRVLSRAGGFNGEPFAPGGEQVWTAAVSDPAD